MNPRSDEEVHTNKEKMSQNSEQQFSILHQNVCSLGNAKDRLEEILNDNEDIKILCITEHWKTEHQLKFYSIKDFLLITFFCRDEKEHGGVAIYSKNGIQVKERKDIKKISTKGKFECAGIEYSLNGIKHVCISVYNDGNVNTLTEALEPLLQKLFNENVRITLIGDFNIDFSDDSSKKWQILGMLKTYNIQQTIYQPTRITATTATCIDNIFTNMEESYETRVIQTHISDHTAQQISFKIGNRLTKKTYKRIYSLENIQNFKQILRDQNWTVLYGIPDKDVNEQFNIFHNIYSELFNRAFPLRKVSNNKKRKMANKNPIIEEMKNRLDILLVISTYDERFKEKYHETKIEYDQLLVQQKKKKFETLIETSDNKNKTIWTVINSLKNTNKKKTESIGDPFQTANEMNNFFIGEGNKLTKNIQNKKPIDNIQELNRSIYLKKITEEETNKLIKSLKNKHSSGYDEISNHIIKQTTDEITVCITHIINNSLRHGIFPDKLKIAIVKPIHKKGDKEDYNNYRPISILPSFSKIMEMAYCQQIMEYLIENKVLRENQHGYLKGKSIKTAVYQFINKIVEAFENKDLAMGVFLDLTKAYDCLESEKLFNKLDSYGIRGPALDWVKSYLSRRQQMVEMEINGAIIRSNLEELILGIPQGSIAGPLLFVIYLNDFKLDKEMENQTVTVVNYADDTNLLLIKNLYPELENLCEYTLNETNEWFKNNNLLLNEEKTKFILFSPTNSGIVENNTITLSQVKYNISESNKFLGIHIDKNLNWKKHINYLYEKTTIAVYGFRIMARYLYSNYLKTVYHAMIEAKLRFGIVFYGAGNITQLFILQKRAVRILNNIKYDESCRGIFKKSGILTIHALYIQECVLFIRNNKILFEKHENRRTFYDTRNEDFIYPKHNLTTSQKQAEYRSLKLFNNLPKNIKANPNITSFKKSLFKYLLDLEPYSLEEFVSNSRIQ